jgi:hypothetical protein
MESDYLGGEIDMLSPLQLGGRADGISRRSVGARRLACGAGPGAYPW